MMSPDDPRLHDSGTHPTGTVAQWVSCSSGSVLAKAGVVSLGLSGNVPGYRISRPLSLDHIVIITIAGAGWMEAAGDERRVLGPGSIALLPAGAAHAYGVDRGSWDIAWLNFDGHRRLAGMPTTAVVRPPRSSLAHAISGLAQEHCGPRASEALSHWSALVLLSLRRELSADARVAPEALTDLWSTVAGRLHEAWSLPRLAKTAGCSVDALDALCRRHLGLAPGRHLALLRLRRAQELLIATSLTVVQIAPMVGYPDPFSFSRAFSRWAGCSPIRFRQRFGG
ncbi:MAG: helix-turn-helix transcriptional regulator [Planctomycetes bacterium]|nr:helix-turn-helix transcriptional regulator [Planctomycetota bacterium]